MVAKDGASWALPSSPMIGLEKHRSAKIPTPINRNYIFTVYLWIVLKRERAFYFSVKIFLNLSFEAMLADIQEMEVIFRKFSLISLRKITHNCLHLVLRPLHFLHFHVPPGEVSKIQCRMYISLVGPPTSAFNLFFGLYTASIIYTPSEMSEVQYLEPRQGYSQLP